MTVRTWFRLARAAAWEHWHLPEITIYFRRQVPDRLGPWSPPTDVDSLTDLQRLLAQGPPEFPEALIQRELRAHLFRDELRRSDITS